MMKLCRPADSTENHPQEFLEGLFLAVSAGVKHEQQECFQSALDDQAQQNLTRFYLTAVSRAFGLLCLDLQITSL